MKEYLKIFHRAKQKEIEIEEYLGKDVTNM
jgi:hypothetical protein